MSMPKKTKMLFITLAIALISIPLLGYRTFSMAELPRIITITAYGTGGHGGFLSMTFCEALTKQLGVRVRPTPAEHDMGRLLPVKIGEAEATVISAGTVYTAGNGLAEFANPKWGPQRLRLMWCANQLTSGLVVKADSGIKEWNDLKGKKIAVPPGLFIFLVKGYLAYGGLNMDDVVVVKSSGYSNSIKMVMDNAADACVLSPLSGIAKEFDAKYGIRFMPMDENNKVAWTRLSKFAPFLAPSYTELGALGKRGPQCLAIYPYTMVTYPEVDTEIIYAMVKGLDEGRNLYKDVRPPLTEQFTLKSALDLEKPVYIPYHPALIKYAKEMGQWTEKHQAWQEEALMNEEKRIKAYNLK